MAGRKDGSRTELRPGKRGRRFSVVEDEEQCEAQDPHSGVVEREIGCGRGSTP